MVATETFPTRCPITIEKNTIAIIFSVIFTIYFCVFIASNVVLRIPLRNEADDNILDFNLKSVTIGMIFIVAALGVAAMILLLPRSDFDLRIVYTIILLDISALLLYIIKEKEFTFPYILSLWNRFRNTNAVVPGPLPALPLQELNPRVLENNRAGQGCRIIDLEDDGGIFIG